MSYYNSKGEAISAAVFYALLAARKRNSIGRFAAMRYYQKHSNNANLYYYRLACQLQATQEMEELAAATQAASLPTFILQPRNT